MPVVSAAQALGIEVAAIYFSEVEEDAIAVALTHFLHARGMGASARSRSQMWSALCLSTQNLTLEYLGALHVLMYHP